MKLFKYSFLIVLCSICISIKTYSQSITVERKFENDECTMGYLFVNDSLICYSLERADMSNSKNISRIPLGTYKGFIRTDGSKGWRIELLNVPNRENIEIHIGNYTFQITGCTLIGTDAKSENCTVQNSAVAINKLKNALIKMNANLDLDSNSTEQYSITITYK